MKRTLSPSVCFGLAILFALCGRAQNPPPSRQEQACARATAELTSWALSAPPEFGADVLLKVIEDGLILGRERAKVLQLAQVLAPQAQEPVPLATPPIPVATRDAVISFGFRRGIDRQSLSLRIAKLLLEQDSGAALEWFTAIPPGAIAGTPCERTLLYNPTSMVEFIGVLFQRAFSARDRRDGKDLQFLNGQIDRMTSPAEIILFLRLVYQLPLSLPERSALANRAGAQLTRSQDDIRAVQFFWTPLKSALTRLMAPESGDPALALELRRWLVRQRKDNRCAPLPFDDGKRIQRLDIDSEIADFLRPWTSDEDELAAASKQALTAHQNESMFKTGTAAQLDKWLMTLRQEPADMKATDEWQRQAGDLLQAIDEWKPSNESPVTAFLTKARLLSRFITIPASVPTLAAGPAGYLKDASRPAPNSLRDRAILRFVAYMDSAGARTVYDARHVAWFSDLWLLFLQVERFPPENGRLLAHAMLASHHPAMRLYGHLILLRQDRPCFVPAAAAGRDMNPRGVSAK